MPKKRLSQVVVLCFFLTSLGPLPKAAQAQPLLGLPEPGVMVDLSPAFEPAIIKGLTVHKDNPFLFDFIVDTGEAHLAGDALKQEGQRLIKYFLAGLAIPEKDLWVNLSPYEKDRMVPQALGRTAMGRDLLAQDYLLKQITASLIYPEKQLGRAFWDRVYSKARQMYGTAQVPVGTFNKVWIMADRASVFEHGQTALVVDCHLKVMLEEDYLALQKRGHVPRYARNMSPFLHSIASQIVKQIVLPEIEKEVNTGRNFANLRQIFHSIILSSWYKNRLKQALLNRFYADKEKVKGIDLKDPAIKEQIYERYLRAYKKGVFNYIKEDAGTAVPRKYFSGGFAEGAAGHPDFASVVQAAQVFSAEGPGRLVRMDAAMVENPDAAMAADENLLTEQEKEILERPVTQKDVDYINGLIEAIHKRRSEPPDGTVNIKFDVNINDNESLLTWLDELWALERPGLKEDFYFRAAEGLFVSPHNLYNGLSSWLENIRDRMQNELSGRDANAAMMGEELAGKIQANWDKSKLSFDDRRDLVQHMSPSRGEGPWITFGFSLIPGKDMHSEFLHFAEILIELDGSLGYQFVDVSEHFNEVYHRLLMRIYTKGPSKAAHLSGTMFTIQRALKIIKSRLRQSLIRSAADIFSKNYGDSARDIAGQIKLNLFTNSYNLSNANDPIVLSLPGENDKAGEIMAGLAKIFSKIGPLQEEYIPARNVRFENKKIVIYHVFGYLKARNFAAGVLSDIENELTKAAEDNNLARTNRASFNFIMGRGLEEKRALAKSDSAMIKDHQAPGGIDLNTRGMHWSIGKDGQSVEMNIDPAMIARIKREGIDSLSPVILRVTPIQSLWPILGLKAVQKSSF